MNEKANAKKPEGRMNTATRLINRVIRYMLHYYKIPFLIVLACILVTAIATVVGATFPQKLVDDYITPHASERIPGLQRTGVRPRTACVHHGFGCDHRLFLQQDHGQCKPGHHAQTQGRSVQQNGIPANQIF